MKILLPFTKLKEYIEKISVKITDKIYKEELLSAKIKTDKKLYKQYKLSQLGVYAIVDTIIKLSILLIPAIAFGIFEEVFIMLLVFGALRSYAGGAHLKTFEVCIVVTVVVFLIPSIMLNFFKFNYEISNIIILTVYILYTFALIKYAPSETLKKPIKNKKKAKIISIISIIIIATFNILIKSATYRFLTLLAVSYEIILVLPLTKKLIEGGER